MTDFRFQQSNRKMKVIFLDIDGTLVDYEGRIPDSAVSAIREARKNGHQIYLVSGRSKVEVYPEIWEIGFDGYIGANGGYVEKDGKIIFHETISEDKTAEIVNYLKENGLEFYLESDSGLYASENFEKAALGAVRAYTGNKNITVRDVFPFMKFSQPLNREVNKISYLLNDYSDYMKTAERFKEYKNGTWGGIENRPLFGDIAPAGIDKSVGIAKLLEYLKVDLKDTIAIGDAKVDEEMLEFCATSVAMGNGEEEIKKVADFVTTEVDDDGIYNAFVDLNLIDNFLNNA